MSDLLGLCRWRSVDTRETWPLVSQCIVADCETGGGGKKSPQNYYKLLTLAQSKMPVCVMPWHFVWYDNLLAQLAASPAWAELELVTDQCHPG